MYFGIGRGAVTRVNTYTVLAAGLYRHAPEVFPFTPRLCREKADKRGCRTMYFGIGRGAVTRVNTCTVLAAGLYRAGTERRVPLPR